MLTSVELFAAAGGLGMGLARAGFHHRAAAEWNRHACETIRRNLAQGDPLVAGWPLREGDVRDLDYDAIADPIDLFAGGPPCQPFSLGGKHRAHGDRRDMFPAMAAAIRRPRPRAFIVEKLKGLTRPGFAACFDYILARPRCPEIVRAEAETWTAHLDRLRASRSPGSRHDAAYRVLKAADYGVPRTRERVFIAGFRRDLGTAWSFPPPTHARDAMTRDQSSAGSYWARHGLPRPARKARVSEVDAPGLKPWRTVRDALAGLPDPEQKPAAERVPGHRFQPDVRFYPGHSGSPLDWPAKTLKAGDHGGPGGENALLRADGIGRYFTVRESARLQTFPDTYLFAGGWGDAMRQLGNAVPVDLAHAVVSRVADATRAGERTGAAWPVSVTRLGLGPLR